ncbi:MAG TPA: hypothetical protein VK543_11460, partial [Puia sp.]|nr:hypothetical protein [Puia sp.]
MKTILYSVLLSIVLFSCKKQMEEVSATSEFSKAALTKAEGFLKGQLPEAEFEKVDFKNMMFDKEGENYFVRLAWKSTAIDKKLILLQTDSLGTDFKGRIVELDRKESISSSPSFNGRISIKDLARHNILQSDVTAGYVESLHPALFTIQRTSTDAIAPDLALVVPKYSDELPEVVVVGYIPSGGGISLADYYLLSSIISAGSGSGSLVSGPVSGSGGGASGVSGIYSPASVGKGGSSGGSIMINYESSISKPGIDINAYMKCFSGIPDAGAQCSVTIFTDLPVNNNPTELFNWYTGAVGHVFLQLSKSNSGQSVTQVVGFNALKPFPAIFADDFVASKMVDNAGHKFNACLTMYISPAQLNTEINEILSTASDMPYSISNFNCVDFALGVINAIRPTNPLTIPK